MNGLNKNGYAYQKYVKPSKDREKAMAKNKRKKWWAENWIAMIGVFISIISLVVSIIALRA